MSPHAGSKSSKASPVPPRELAFGREPVEHLLDRSLLPRDRTQLGHRLATQCDHDRASVAHQSQIASQTVFQLAGIQCVAPCGHCSYPGWRRKTSSSSYRARISIGNQIVGRRPGGRVAVGLGVGGRVRAGARPTRRRLRRSGAGRGGRWDRRGRGGRARRRDRGGRRRARRWRLRRLRRHRRRGARRRRRGAGQAAVDAHRDGGDGEEDLVVDAQAVLAAGEGLEVRRGAGQQPGGAPDTAGAAAARRPRRGSSAASGPPR